MVTQVLVTIFVLFALSRVLLRYRDGSIGALGMVIWSLLWLVVEIFVWVPSFSELVARQVGIGRGVDVLVYFSIIALFYGIFRLYVKLEFIEHEITSLVRNLALKDEEGRRHSRP